MYKTAVLALDLSPAADALLARDGRTWHSLG